MFPFKKKKKKSKKIKKKKKKNFLPMAQIALEIEMLMK